MKTVLVTGSAGFIGKNLRAQLEQIKDLEVLCFDREKSVSELDDFIKRADFIFHLAGVNRPKNEIEFEKGNKELTEQIIQLLYRYKLKVPLLISSSIQAELDNPYGKSKKASENSVATYGKKSGVPTYIYRLPNVFGKWGRADYNSVVATFCHNISRNIPITVSDPKNKLTLVYIDNVVAEFISAMWGNVKPNPDGYYYIPSTHQVTLGKLKNILTSFYESRNNLIIPSFESDVIRYLYATYTSYLEEDGFDYTLRTNLDDRGWLAEFIKSKQFGQIFVSKTKPGIARGNHWHNTKIEKFLVVDGEAEIIFRKLTENKIIRYKVSGEKLTVLDIPAGYVHAIKNVGAKDLITIFWADEILNSDKPDTIFTNVEKDTKTL